jgi:hypothetical protein
MGEGLNRWMLAGAAAGLLALAGCASGGKVTVLSDAPNSPLGQSYAWASTRPDFQGQGSQVADNQIVRNRLEGSVNRVMQAKGYRAADATQADVLMSYHVGLQQKTETRVDSTPYMGGPMMCGRFGCGGAWNWGYYGPPETSVSTYNYTEGQLILDAVDRRSNKLLWRSVYQDKITSKSADQAAIDKAVDQALKDLPPAAMKPM